MDPQLKSLLTTALAMALGSVATWLISKGIITQDQAPQLIATLSGILLAGGGALVAWWKSRGHAPDQQVLAAKTIPGVSVKVDTSPDSPAPQKVIDMANNPDVKKVDPA